MDEKKYRLPLEPSLALPVSAADKLLSACDGTAALLYLYALRRGDFSGAEAAKSLKRTQAEIEKAAALLSELALLTHGHSQSKSLPLPAEELPEYTAEDIGLRTAESDEFRVVVEETQRILGRMLTGADLKTLFGIYDYLRLPAEIILLLVNHCVEETRRNMGPGKLPSMRTIEKEAYLWHNNELLTLESAEGFLQRKRERTSQMADLRRLLQINGRSFSSSERKYVESWLELGFPLETIALAYDRTIVKTGRLAWSYMNSILQNWHEKKLYTPEAVQAGDGPPSGLRRSYAEPKKEEPAPAESQDELARMKKILERVKNR